MSENLEVLRALSQWEQAGKRAVLATVVSAWGSAPRRPGSQMAIREDGHIVGSVSGGCVEGDVIAQALEMMDSLEEGDVAPIRQADYGVSDASAWAVGLACGGQIRVHLHHPKAGFAVATLAAMSETGEVTVALDVGEDAAVSVTYAAPLRLLILGGVHIAQALVALAPTVGFAPTIIDPRGGFASPERFPDVPLITDWPDQAITDFGIDARTAVVALTHDEKLDDPALLAAFASNAFYIGALGSKRTQASRRERMLDAGISEENYARLHGPIGLDIGAANPQEIAVAILGQMIAALRGKA
mgnify:CR=1 FL=1